ncbi:hypothetical protein [Hymenobacter lucidus]|uniref:SDR family NAD(P)-dependent oxidoreductase n=1 Tax=Hymenobacter lucidus TaxID=2880930 RepID=A0ABS8ASL6_9BACT|nr:hypothetical protein [Hymenobacter lucidus]MCB2409079.1 hypothetical protein [Hymenobacter lucidus]
MSTSQTWLVTGASQDLGLGLALALQLAAGHRVAATARHLGQVLGRASPTFLPLQTDLTHEACVAQAIAEAMHTLDTWHPLTVSTSFEQ